jgi:hypothetical protein
VCLKITSHFDISPCVALNQQLFYPAFPAHYRTTGKTLLNLNVEDHLSEKQVLISVIKQKTGKHISSYMCLIKTLAVWSTARGKNRKQPVLPGRRLCLTDAAKYRC